MTKKTLNKDEYYMSIALEEAKKAYKLEEVPVGCVIVYQDKILAKSHNTRHKTKSVFDHAELIAIKKASKKINSWILEDCEMYVTLEPCLMCASAIIQSRIKRIIYAANEPKFGAFGSITDLSILPLNHHIVVTKGILSIESANLLKSFFKELREKKLVPNLTNDNK